MSSSCSQTLDPASNSTNMHKHKLDLLRSPASRLVQIVSVGRLTETVFDKKTRSFYRSEGRVDGGGGGGMYSEILAVVMYQCVGLGGQTAVGAGLCWPLLLWQLSDPAPCLSRR